MTQTPAAPQPGFPRPPRPAGRDGSAALLAVGFVLIAVCLPLVGIVVLATVGVGGFLLGLFLAVIPVVPVLAYFSWLDRWEPEPRALLVFAFGWGAAVATLGSLVFNTASAVVLSATGDPGAEMTTATLVAPVVEEAFKGVGLLAILAVARRPFDGVVDGFVYAGMVGAGFAFVENILYLGQALLEAGGTGLVTTFVVRGIFSPFAHPLFTAVTGVAIAYASRRFSTRWPVVLLGYVGAVLLHGLWNGAAVGAPLAFLGLYVAVQVPLFVTYVVVAVMARRREGRLIGAHLTAYQQVGWFTPGELRMVAVLGERREALRRAGAADPRLREAMRRFHHNSVRLAYLRNRMVRGTAPPDARRQEYELLQLISAGRPGGGWA